MAWDSASFPWEWDAETFHIPGHGTGADFRKSCGNSRSLETDLCVGKNGVSSHNNQELSPHVLTTGGISLAKHDVSQEEWQASSIGLAKGVIKDASVPTRSTTSSTKPDATHVDWHASLHNSGSSKEGGHTAASTSPTKHGALDVDMHLSWHLNGVNKEGPPMIYPACSSRLTESNSSWRHANGLVDSALESTYNVMPSVGHGDVSCVTTGVLPIVTTCTGAKNVPFVGCNDNSGGAQGPGKAVQKRLNDPWGKKEFGFAGVFEPDIQHVSSLQHAHHENMITKEKAHLSEIKVKEEKGVVSSSMGVRTPQMDEQHSSNATGSAGSGDSFTGLHLGKRTYSQDASKATTSKPAQRPVLASKKARIGVAIPRCQVEGCKLDLTPAKDYHRRHKVCEPHSKAGKVVVAGTEQRFCQQCSRFHLISEFDEAKRSCRRRLAGHNERRRKPQPDPLALHARLHSTFEDWSFLHQSRFSRMPLLWQDPGDFRSNGMWPRLTTHATGVFDNLSACDYTLQGPAIAERQRYLKSLSQQSLSYHDKLSLLLLQSPKSVMPSNGAYPRVQQYPTEGFGGLMGDSLSLAPSSTGVGALPGLDITPVTRGVTRVTDSGRALSLLSLQTRGSQAPDVLMHDPPGLANVAALNHQLGHHEEVIVPQQFLLQGGPQYYDDVSVEKSMVSTPFPSLQAQSSSAHLGSLMTFDRDLGECSFGHDSNRQASNHPLFALLPYHQQDPHEGAAG